MSIKVRDRKEASEVVEAWNKQGFGGIVTKRGSDIYVEKVSENKEKGKYKDFNELEKENKELSNMVDGVKEATGEGGNRLQRAGMSFTSGKGIIGAIRRTLTPARNSNLVKIASMPGRKSPIASVKNGANRISGKGAGMKRRRISTVPEDCD